MMVFCSWVVQIHLSGFLTSPSRPISSVIVGIAEVFFTYESKSMTGEEGEEGRIGRTAYCGRFLSDNLTFVIPSQPSLQWEITELQLLVDQLFKGSMLEGAIYLAPPILMVN